MATTQASDNQFSLIATIIDSASRSEASINAFVNEIFLKAGKGYLPGYKETILYIQYIV